MIASAGTLYANLANESSLDQQHGEKLVSPQAIDHPQAKSRFTKWWTLVQMAGNGWSKDKAPALGAALASYAAFSLAPLLVIALGIASFIFPREAVREHLLDELAYFVGQRGAAGIR